MQGEGSSGGPGISRNVQPNGFGITMSEIQPYVFTESSGCLNVYNASEWGKCKTISQQLSFKFFSNSEPF